MNIFFLDHDVEACARYHNDKHVVKMVLESVQMLCTVNYLHHNHLDLYRPTHVKHPCVSWTSTCLNNYQWLYSLTEALGVEYTLRFGRNHRSIEVLNKIPKQLNTLQEFSCITEPVQAMPDRYRVPGDAVQAYRNYYIGAKRHLARWSFPSCQPEWYS